MYILNAFLNAMANHQVSVGYFFTDLVMIFWLYPCLGGMEYVSTLPSNYIQISSEAIGIHSCNLSFRRIKFL